MPLFSELFLSELTGRTVLDHRGDPLGTLKDLVVAPGNPLPRVDALVVESRARGRVRVPWADMSYFSKGILSARAPAESFQPFDDAGEDLLAVRDLLDKQIVDANGARVVRVNDVKFDGYKDDAVLIAVDVGVRGLLRRLGFERMGVGFLRFFRVRLRTHLISWNYLQPLSPKLSSIGLTVPRQMVEELHPADIADLISQVSQTEGVEFIQNLDVEIAAEALSEMAPEDQTAVIREMDADRAAEIIEEMSPDTAADLINSLPPDVAHQILGNIEQEDAEDIQELLGHESDTAGGIMTNEFISYPPHITVTELLERFRYEAPETESVFYIYVIDEQERLLGVASLKEVILASPSDTLGSFMETNIKSVRPEADEMVVAATISKYNLVALPVVDCDTCLVGIVTVDDILERILPRQARRHRRSV
jgi:CBS domain-containing protein